MNGMTAALIGQGAEIAPNNPASVDAPRRISLRSMRRGRRATEQIR